MYEIDDGMDCFQIQNAKLCSFCKIHISAKTEGHLDKKFKTSPELDLAPNLALYGRIQDFSIQEPHLLAQNALLIKQKKAEINEIAIFIEKSFPKETLEHCFYCDLMGRSELGITNGMRIFYNLKNS
jgi:hypothetical protein